MYYEKNEKKEVNCEFDIVALFVNLSLLFVADTFIYKREVDIKNYSQLLIK